MVSLGSWAGSPAGYRREKKSDSYPGSRQHEGRFNYGKLRRERHLAPSLQFGAQVRILGRRSLLYLIVLRRRATPFMNLRPLPDAVILGAMRSGTTFLHAALQQHPQVAETKRKELHYFTMNWGKGPKYYRSQMPLRWPKWMYRLCLKERPIVLDSTPYYLFHPDAPKRLRDVLGAPKCIVLLREPGIRAWSHYHHMLTLGCEYLGFRDAVDREAARSNFEPACPELDPAATGHMLYSYTARGFYADQLRHWWKYVPRDRFLLLCSEDLFAHPQSAFDEVCDFLKLKRMKLPSGLPHNARSQSPLPEFMRARLADLYAAPNHDLFELTGITWPRVSFPPSPSHGDACL